MENARRQLEELDRIEQALEARIRRSSAWLPPQIRIAKPSQGRRLSARVRALQRWEAARLVEKYNTISREFSFTSAAAPVSDFEAELKECMALSDSKPAHDLSAPYAQRLYARGRERFICDATEAVISEIDTKYPPNEDWGQIMRLEPFYRALVAAAEVSMKPEGYRDYLANFSAYAEFGSEALVQYLVEFYDRAYAVGPGTQALDLPAVREIIESTRADPLFCKACNHKFANPAVFQAHLSGRKHKRAATGLNHAELVANKELVLVLSDALRGAFETTIANIDRKAGMTEQERRLEVEALERGRLREDMELSGEESDDTSREPGPTKQLIGPEGRPIPRWLYKLHGLSTIFKCKICEPHVKVAGRAQFERHFRDPKHTQGLRRLGITPSDAYRGITIPTDALDLQQALKHETSADGKEVEDDEGNVMSEKMMADLRKQGLL